MKFLRGLIMGLRNLPEGEVGRKVYAERVELCEVRTLRRPLATLRSKTSTKLQKSVL